VGRAPRQTTTVSAVEPRPGAARAKAPPPAAHSPAGVEWAHLEYFDQLECRRNAARFGLVGVRRVDYRRNVAHSALAVVPRGESRGNGGHSGEK